MATPETLRLRRRAEALASAYPTLLAEAERVAAIVSQGDHGRRRSGQGETFWQYRDYDTSDPANRIDWRRSARGEGVFVRETEWEAANSVFFWRDGSAGMDWASAESLPTERDRATVICMALASLLMRAGERCAVLGESDRPRAGRAGLERLTRRLAHSEGEAARLSAQMPRHATLVVASDFLEGADVWSERLALFSARPVRGVLLHVIDPAERQFPYRGRMRLRLPGFEDLLVGRAETARTRYQTRFEAHVEAIAETARRLGWPLVLHETDKPATLALTALHQILSGDRL